MYAASCVLFRPMLGLGQSSYLSQISQIIFVEKKLSSEDFLENFGDILGNFEKFWEILPQFMRFNVEKK